MESLNSPTLSEDNENFIGFSKLVLNVNSSESNIISSFDGEGNNLDPNITKNHESEEEDEDEEDEDELESEITIEENLNPTIRNAIEKNNTLFEHFLVVGLPANSTPKIGFIHKPELLFSYPPNREPPPKIPEFCFPNGVIPYLVKRTPSCSNLNELLYGQPHLHSSTHFYTFVLSGETPLYGICITKPELLSTFPNFFPTQPQPLERLQHYINAPRCYCLVSKSPFFSIHFDLLLYLLAQDRLITITRELSSENEVENQNNTDTKITEQDKTISTETTEITATVENKESISTEILTDTTPESEQDTTPPVKTSTLEKNPFNSRETKHLVDKQNLLDILDYYHKQKPLEPGGSYEFSFPGEVSVRKYLIPAGKNTTESNYKSIADWSLMSTFLNLNLENILKILGAVLVEQRVVFVCDNLSTLSSASFTVSSFIYPFIWQGLFVPILPANLVDYLEAPVPFIAGVQALRKSNFDGLIVDINSNKIIYNKCSVPPLLPEFKKLHRNLTPDTTALIQQKNHNPTKNTPVQAESIHRIYNTVQNYIWWLVKKIETQFSNDPVDIHDSLEVDKFKKRFISSVSEHNKEFVKLLLDTQHFNHFLHNNPNIKEYIKNLKPNNN